MLELGALTGEEMFGWLRETERFVGMVPAHASQGSTRPRLLVL
ncbi:MAG TPA: hypothetical protein VM184_09495 [Gaiellaceae bacterium]|nr:hypothetical protein [Gaiellaceae bacterium]